MAKKLGFECSIPSLPMTAVREYKQETKSISPEPGSVKMDLNGAKNPFFILERFRQYDPIIIRRMPNMPVEFNFSPRKTRPVRIIKAGVNARKGSVSERGETFIAFM